MECPTQLNTFNIPFYLIPLCTSARFESHLSSEFGACRSLLIPISTVRDNQLPTLNPGFLNYEKEISEVPSHPESDDFGGLSSITDLHWLSENIPRTDRGQE